jgi:plastocyanin
VRTSRGSTGRHAAAAALLALGIGCGGGGSPTGPSSGGPTVRSTGSVGAIGATITIANGTVSPSQVTIAAGQSVRFVNTDSRGRNVSSDPHPAHTACPSFENIGNLSASQTKDTFGFAAAGSCTFHDHNDDGNAGMKGRVTIQ